MGLLHSLRVRDGSVRCPHAAPGGVDVETCYACPSFRGLERGRGDAAVVCRTATGTAAGLAAARAWPPRDR